MSRFTIFSVIAIVLFFTLQSFSQPIIINEIYNSSSTGEWVELLVVQDNIDFRGWDIHDFTNSGGSGATLTFANNSLWSSLRKGTLVVIGQSDFVTVEDTDPSDYLLIIKGTNSLYFSGTVFTIGGTSEAVQIRNASDTHIIGVSWGSANANSIPQPKVHFTGSSTSGTSTIFNGNDTAQVTSTGNWTQNTTSSRGAGNGGANSLWITTLRARQEGSGSVSISPQEINGSIDTILTIIYHRDAAYSITALRIIVPSEFVWSQSAADVSFNNMTATLSVSHDTILFSDISFTVDSTEITIANITTPLFTGYYQFKVQSGSVGSFGDVAPTPTVTVFGASIPIADAKLNDTNGVALRLGDLVTVQGIITVANEFGSPSYIQDNSGGMSIFGTNFSSSVTIGDEVVVTARVAQFNGLNQIELPIRYEVLSSGNSVDPILTTPTELKSDGFRGIENYEGLLVRLNNVTVTELNGNPVFNWVANTNYRLVSSSPSDTVQLRIDNNTNLVGAVAPAGVFDVIGVLGQFKTTPPYIGGYQLMPRSLNDILADGPIISEFPKESNITSSSMTISFKTVNPGTSRLRYGTTTAYELGVIEPDNTPRTNHSIDMTGLSAATMYHVQAFSVAGGDTSFAGNLIVSTASPAGTTGQINVYFTKSVDTMVARGEKATGNVNLVSRVVARINNARRSIDAALYSLSGTPGPGSDVAEALVNAKNRGVKVRVIGEYDNRTTAPWSILSNNGIPVIFDRYGANDGSGLHHNKFFVFDYKGGAPESVWVWTGSWNPTEPGTFSDRQNAIEIQDVALAGAYTAEFEEMWGSSTQTPNSTLSRFGARKTDNVPHNFVINGVPVQVYFSPGDRVRAQIARVLGRAQNSVNVAMLTFTRQDIADSLIVQKNRGKKVRVVLDNNTDQGNQFSRLQSAGVDVLLKGFTNALLHHKYAVVDAEPGSNPGWTITGSYNWSSSAENSNDENILIIQNDRVANLYLQEFSARYTEAGGSDPIVLGVREVGNGIPEKFSLEQNYPNPFNPVTTIGFRLQAAGFTSLKVYNVLGQEVATLVNEELKAGAYEVHWNASTLASGIYFYQITTGSFLDMKKMLLIK